MAVRKLQYLYARGILVTLCFVIGCTSTSPDYPSRAEITTPTQTNVESGFTVNERGYWERLVAGHTFVEIPEGTFPMGSDHGEYKELPIHDVYLDRYWIAKYPITVAQFGSFVESTGYVTDNERGEGCWIEAGGAIRYDLDWRHPNFDQGPNHPVICVSWNDAMAYAEWFSRKNNVNASLPTEAQWEKAARGTDQRMWPWGNEPPDGTRANFADTNYLRVFGPDQRNADGTIDDGYPQTSPVDTYDKGQSPYGVFDMAGNTIDWIYDWYEASYYARSPTANPIGPEKNPVRRKLEIPGGWGDNLQRSIRGGAWTDASGVLSVEEGGHSVRSDMRERTDQYSSDDHLGFRLVIDGIDRYPRYVPAVEKAHQSPTTQ
jgi:formylglycine-generating enzyme required for sulfatase activity